MLYLKKRFFIIFVILNIWVGLFCQNKLNWFSPNEAIEDINCVRDAYLTFYPIPFKFCDSLEYEKKYQSIIEEIKTKYPAKIDSRQISIYCNELNSIIKDGHSSVEFNFASIKNLVFAKYIYFSLYIKRNELYIEKVLDKKSKLKSGDKIISINDVPADTIICLFQRLSSKENEEFFPNDYCSMSPYFIKSNCVNARKIRVSASRDNEKIYEERKGINLIKNKVRDNTWDNDTTFYKYQFKRKLYKISKPIISYNRGSLERSIVFFDNSEMSYWRNNTLNSAILRINGFEAVGNYYTSQFFTEMFDDIRKDSLGNLIIDIRGNLGGGHFETYELLKYIYRGEFKNADGYIISNYKIKNKDLNKLSVSENIEQLPNNRIKIKNTGNVLSRELLLSFNIDTVNTPPIYRFKNIYIIIDKNIYSQSIIFSYSMKYNIKNCTIIGETPLAPKWICSRYWPFKSLMAPKPLITKNSKLLIKMPHLCHIPPDGILINKPIQPDIEIESDKIDDFLIEKILRH